MTTLTAPSAGLAIAWPRWVPAVWTGFVLGALLLDVVPRAVWSAVVSLAAVVLAALAAMRFGAAHYAENVGATSTGAFVLAAAGLLDGHRVMTHAAYGDRLRGLGVECVARRGSTTAGT